MLLPLVLNLAKEMHSTGCVWGRDRGKQSGESQVRKGLESVKWMFKPGFYWKSLSRFLRDPAELGASRCHCKSEVLDESGSQNISAFMIHGQLFLFLKQR